MKSGQACRSRLRLILCLSLSLSATSTSAADISRASEGFVYFHKSEATFQDHNREVKDCIDVSAKMMTPFTPEYGGIVGDIIEEAQRGKAYRLNLAANIENCMIIKGWEVVRIPDNVGASLESATPNEQATALSNWVGATEPFGTVVRRYEPFSSIMKSGGGLYDKARESLSVSASGYSPSQGAQPAAFQAVSAIDPSRLPSGVSAIVVRTTSLRPPNFAIWFTDAGKSSSSQERGHWLLFAPIPMKFMQRSLLEKIYIFPVQPGRWQLGGRQGFTTCLSGPAFDVAEGEVVFAGTFSSAAPDPLVPDLNIEEAIPSLSGTGLDSRLTTARYFNGSTFPCDQIPSTWLYKHEIPQTP